MLMVMQNTQVSTCDTPREANRARLPPASVWNSCCTSHKRSLHTNRCKLLEKFKIFGLLQVWLVAADCMLIGIQPILIHLSKNASSGYSYHPVSVTISVEAVKTVMAAAMLVIFVRFFQAPSEPLSRLLAHPARHFASAYNQVKILNLSSEKDTTPC